MNKFVENIIKFRWVIAILIPLMTFGIASQLKHLEFEGSYRIWFGEDSKILNDYDNFRMVFGNDDAVTIIFRDEDGVMNAKALHVIDNITQKLWTTKYIARADSLTNFQYVHTDPEYPDEVLVEDFIDDIDAMSAEDFAEKARIIQNEDTVVHRLISEDGKTTMIVGRMTPKAGDDPEVAANLKASVEAIVAAEKASGYEFRLGGGPILNMAFIIFRRPSGMFLSIAVVIFTFLIVLSVQVLLGYKMNNFTANIPVFVVAIGIADAMHLFWIYLIGRRKGMDNHEAIHYSVDKNFLPVLLTSLTTAVGFASLGISHIIPIKTLGIATANAALRCKDTHLLFTALFSHRSGHHKGEGRLKHGTLFQRRG
jgi:predicted RND superfamily exporter protein